MEMPKALHDYTFNPTQTLTTMEPNPTPSPAFARVLIWDEPTRVCHWLLAVCFAGAYWTADLDDWESVHATLGYTASGLALFRIVWGFVGTRYARFSESLQSPAAVARYVVQMPHGWGKRYMGHSPVSSIFVVVILSLALVLGATGWMARDAFSSASIVQLHDGVAYMALGLIGLHMAGVVLSNWRAGESLLLPMLNGTKLGNPSEAIHKTWRSVAVLIIAAVSGFWLYQ